MRSFNPDKELNKIKYGKRNKVILLIISLLVVGVMGYSFALYQVRYSKRIIYTKVAQFNNKDINILAVYIDNVLSDDFPTNDQDYVYDHIDCDNKNTVAYWDYNKWALIMETSKKTKCNVYFRTGTDRSGANAPELYQGLIPVTIENDGTIKVADTTKEWYNYQEHKWANAILIDDETNHNKYYNEDGTYKKDTVIPIEDVLQMYVWILRYKYKLFNTISGQSIQPQMIEIEFERGTETTGTVTCSIESNGVETCENAENGEWYTHPAFTFGNTNLTGIWVGKFESSDKNSINTNANVNNGSTISSITIIPNKVSITKKNLRIIFDATRSIESDSQYNLKSNEVDSHIMKNSEWGAVAYLSQSKFGIFNKVDDTISCSVDSNLSEKECRIWNNNILHGTASNEDGAITGCGGNVIDAASIYNNSSCPENQTWEKVPQASTTGNIYGIYDMSGGMWEYVMGNMAKDGKFYPSNATITDTEINKKYYDSYLYGTSLTTHNRGHLGDATRETLEIYGDYHNGGWHTDAAWFPCDTGAWFMRGGHGNNVKNAGIFAFDRRTGDNDQYPSFRVVLTAQDSNS